MDKFKIFLILTLAEAFLRAIIAGNEEDPLDFKKDALKVSLARLTIEKKMKPNVAKNLRNYLGKRIKTLKPNTMDFKHVVALTLNYLVFVEIALDAPAYADVKGLITSCKDSLLLKSELAISSEMLQNTEAEADMYITELLKAI